MIRYTGQTVKEVLIGIGILGVIGTALILGIWQLQEGILWGYLLGLAMAAAAFLHMSITLETTVDTMDEKAGKNHAVRNYLIRLVVLFGVLFLALKSGWFNMLAVVVGLFMLKPAIYLSRGVHRIIKKQD